MINHSKVKWVKIIFFHHMQSAALTHSSNHTTLQQRQQCPSEGCWEANQDMAEGADLVPELCTSQANDAFTGCAGTSQSQVVVPSYQLPDPKNLLPRQDTLKAHLCSTLNIYMDNQRLFHLFFLIFMWLCKRCLTYIRLLMASPTGIQYNTAQRIK